MNFKNGWKVKWNFPLRAPNIWGSTVFKCHEDSYKIKTQSYNGVKRVSNTTLYVRTFFANKNQKKIKWKSGTCKYRLRTYWVDHQTDYAVCQVFLLSLLATISAYHQLSSKMTCYTCSMNYKKLCRIWANKII